MRREIYDFCTKKESPKISIFPPFSRLVGKKMLSELSFVEIFPDFSYSSEGKNPTKSRIRIIEFYLAKDSRLKLKKFQLSFSLYYFTCLF